MNAALLGLHKALFRPHIRCINYHEVASEHADAFEQQLRHYAKHFAPVGRDELFALHEDRWQADKPGLLITFDDGLRSHIEVAAPLLEKYGMTGWFMVPAAAVRDAPGAPEWEHTVPYETLDYAGLRELDRRHVIGCHTFSHRRLEASLSSDEITREIPEAPPRAPRRGLT